MMLLKSYRSIFLALLAAGLAFNSSAQAGSCCGNAAPEPLLPADWDPVKAGNEVIERLISVTAPHVKGAHDGGFVIVDNHAYIVSTVNDELPGHSRAQMEYVDMSIVNLDTMEVEMASFPIAKPGQVFENETLPRTRFTWCPRIAQIDERTLRTFFTSGPELNHAQIWYRDFDLTTREFKNTIHRAKLKTATGTYLMTPHHFHASAVREGFGGNLAWSFFIIDTFKEFDGKTYIGINNFAGRQNALARMNEAFDTFEVVGHINQPEALQLSENAINRLPDGTWMAILRSDTGSRNYAFSFSGDGHTWTPAEHKDFVQNGTSSKPTLDKFNGIYYLGWQDAAQVDGVGRTIFNLDVSRDGKHWERKYRFETRNGFEYPTFIEHNGVIWVRLSGNNQRTIHFGKLEKIGG